MARPASSRRVHVLKCGRHRLAVGIGLGREPALVGVSPHHHRLVGAEGEGGFVLLGEIADAAGGLFPLESVDGFAVQRDAS